VQQPSRNDNYYLTKEEMELGIQVIKSKVLALFNDAKILAKNKGTPEHCVGLYLFGVEEFGKLLLLEDSLKANRVGDKYAVDKSIFGRKSKKKKKLAHELKFDRALKTLPEESQTRFKSVIVTIGLSKPFTVPRTNPNPMLDAGEVTIPKDVTGTFSDITHTHIELPLHTYKFTVGERVWGFLIDWDNDARQWTSNEVQTESGRVQISVAPWDLLKIVGSAEKFVRAYH